jgi:hypothetical protein
VGRLLANRNPKSTFVSRARVTGLGRAGFRTPDLIEHRGGKVRSHVAGMNRLPAVNFSFPASFKGEQINSLNGLEFIERREKVSFLGPPNLGRPRTTVLCVRIVTGWNPLGGLLRLTQRSGQRLHTGSSRRGFVEDVE